MKATLPTVSRLARDSVAEAAVGGALLGVVPVCVLALVPVVSAVKMFRHP